MKTREAISVLMLSPFYFRLALSQRKDLIKEYCHTCNTEEVVQDNSGYLTAGDLVYRRIAPGTV